MYTDLDLKSSISNTFNNLIIAHDNTEAFRGANIIVLKDNDRQILGNINYQLPTILLYNSNNKYYALYDKDNGIFHTKTKFIKDIIDNKL